VGGRISGAEAELLSARPPEDSLPLIERERQSTLLFTGYMSERFRKSVGPFFDHDIFLRFFYDRMLAVLAQYDLRHFNNLH
jgi:hypothetical protein